MYLWTPNYNDVVVEVVQRGKIGNREMYGIAHMTFQKRSWNNLSLNKDWQIKFKKSVTHSKDDYQNKTKTTHQKTGPFEMAWKKDTTLYKAQSIA